MGVNMYPNTPNIYTIPTPVQLVKTSYSPVKARLVHLNNISSHELPFKCV